MIPSPMNAGFSLTEVLIAVTILGMMGTMTFGTFSSAVNSREVALEIAEREHEVRLAGDCAQSVIAQSLDRLNETRAFDPIGFARTCQEGMVAQRGLRHAGDAPARIDDQTLRLCRRARAGHDARFASARPDFLRLAGRQPG